jgi:hypothetical protein
VKALYPYQQVGAAFLAARIIAFLLDAMGLGKTIVSIVGADLIRAIRRYSTYAARGAPRDLRGADLGSGRRGAMRFAVPSHRPGALSSRFNRLISRIDRRTRRWCRAAQST